MSEEISGVILINKESGMTSHDVVNKLRKIFHTKKVGHTGTLDPMAKGVLTVLVGNAVKASEYLVSDSKTYRARMVMGITTDTEDTTGTILERCDRLPSLERVKLACAGFVGSYMQTPPMYSALKVNGQKLCDLARKGEVIEREAREVTISGICDISQISENEFEMTCDVSKGTYIRTLIADIGNAIGCGAAMSDLTRLKSGSFDISDAHFISELESSENPEKFVIPTESLFDEYPKISVAPFYERLAKCGNEIYFDRAKISYPGKTNEEAIGLFARMADEKGNFFALAEVKAYESGVALKAVKFFYD